MTHEIKTLTKSTISLKYATLPGAYNNCKAATSVCVLTHVINGLQVHWNI